MVWRTKNLAKMVWRRSDAKVIDELDQTDRRDADAKPEEAADAGEEVHRAVQLLQNKTF